MVSLIVFSVGIVSFKYVGLSVGIFSLKHVGLDSDGFIHFLLVGIVSFQYVGICPNWIVNAFLRSHFGLDQRNPSY